MSLLKVTVHVPVPLHAPPQPTKVEFGPGVAVSVTLVPCWNVALHVCPQLIPEGALLTVPLPAPAAWTCNSNEPGGVGGGVEPVPPPQLTKKRSKTE